MDTAKQLRSAKRPENWAEALAVYLDSHRDIPFAWGAQDCCLFAADWVEICIGIDPAESWRGKYETQAGALKILKKHKGVRGLADKQFKRCKLGFANRGDLVAYRDPSLKGSALVTTALGILDGRYGLFATKRGVEPVLRTDLMKTAWKVGAA
tara:strand:- start:6127 stop:6585 length:459 start_codon:yes stop_codon:yes gene_type:complete